MTYNDSYTHSKEETICITFDIGATVSVDSIIVNPTVTDCKMILELEKNKAFSKTLQFWFPLSFFDASSDLPVDLSSFSASDFVIPKHQTPDGKVFVIWQDRVSIGITDSRRHENTPVTINSRREDDRYN